jgi:hypothetical protein
MSYIGLQPNTPLLNTSTEYISGNGILFQFTLSRSIASASDIDVMIGSTLQRPGTDYTAGGTTLLFFSPPVAGSSNITVTYRAGALNSLNLTVNTFNSGTVAAPGVVSLAANNTGIYWPAANSMRVTVSGTERASFNANATSVSTSTGALVINGGIGAAGDINTSGRVVITDNTQSTSLVTGSLTTNGGIAAIGNLNIGGDITCVGAFTVNGTFTTTGSESLTVTDPFIFLANANPGDSFDTGVISEFFDGTNTRYTGYFRDVTDQKFKLFGNLLTKPTTVVDTTDPSFVFDDLILANLSATGNVSATNFIGNGAGLTGIAIDTTQILNSNSKVIIPSVNSNIISNVNGATVTTTFSGGLSVVGTVSASTALSTTGNVNAGNINTAGLISAAGSITSAANVTGGNLLTGGAISTAGNITGGNILGGANVNATTHTGTTVSVSGNITGGNILGGANVNATTLTGTTVSVTGNITGGNILGGANVNATTHTGDTVSVTGNITGGNILGGANVNATTLTGSTVSVTGNITTGGNILFNSGTISGTGLVTTGSFTVTGNITASATTQDINLGTSQTTGSITLGGAIQTGTTTVGQSTATHTTSISSAATGTGNIKTIALGVGGLAGSSTNINVGPVTDTTAAGLVTFNTATRVAIANTSGTALSVVGNITGGNLLTGGLISLAGNITAGNLNAVGISLTGNVASPISTASNITGGNLNAIGISLSGNVVSTLVSAFAITTTANITGGNLLFGTGVVTGTGNISTTGNISGGNVIGTHVGSVAFAAGSVSGTGNITGGNIIGTHVGSVNFAAGLVSGTGNIDGGNLRTGGLISATGGITGAGIAGTSLTVSTGNISGGNINNNNLTGVGNIGTATVGFNTIFAKATSAQYADLAEWYEADADYEPGTVLVFGGSKEVTLAIGINDVRVAGVVSTNPAHIMNSGLKAPHVAAVALTGRVPTQVVGPVAKGDMMVTAGGGRAQACAEPRLGSVIGKALQDHPGGQGTIEIVVGRM